MAGILSSDLAVWAIVKEATYGTDSVASAIDANTNFVYASMLSGSSMTPTPDFVRPNLVRASQDGVSHAYAANGGSLAFNFLLRGGVGTPNTPACGVLLQTMGLGEAAGASSTVYTIQTANDTSLSAWKWSRNISNDNWRLQRALGVRLTGSFSGTVNQDVSVSATGGCVNSPEYTVDRTYFNASDEPALDETGATVTYTGAATADTSERMLCKSVTLTIGGTAYPCSAFDFDLGFSVGPISAITGSSTVAQLIRSRGDGANASGNLALEMVDASTYGAALDDALTKYAASTEVALVIVVSGSTRKLTINMPKIQLTRPTERPSNGAMGWDLGFAVNGDFASAPFGDNSIVFTFADV